MERVVELVVSVVEVAVEGVVVVSMTVVTILIVVVVAVASSTVEVGVTISGVVVVSVREGICSVVVASSALQKENVAPFIKNSKSNVVPQKKYFLKL